MRQRKRQDKEIDSLKRISGSSQTEITAQFLGVTSLKKYAPDVYNDIARRYGELLDLSIEKRIYKVESNRQTAIFRMNLRKLSKQLAKRERPRTVSQITALQVNS
jgi:hypothetical protein